MTDSTGPQRQAEFSHLQAAQRIIEAVILAGVEADHNGIADAILAEVEADHGPDAVGDTASRYLMLANTLELAGVTPFYQAAKLEADRDFDAASHDCPPVEVCYLCAVIDGQRRGGV